MADGLVRSLPVGAGSALNLLSNLIEDDTVLQVLTKSRIFTMERLLATDDSEIAKATGMSEADVQTVKTIVARQCAAPAKTLGSLLNERRACILQTGCGSLDADNVSERPWNEPKGYQFFGSGNSRRGNR